MASGEVKWFERRWDEVPYVTTTTCNTSGYEYEKAENGWPIQPYFNGTKTG